MNQLSSSLRGSLEAKSSEVCSSTSWRLAAWLNRRTTLICGVKRVLLVVVIIRNRWTDMTTVWYYLVYKMKCEYCLLCFGIIRRRWIASGNCISLGLAIRVFFLLWLRLLFRVLRSLYYPARCPLFCTFLSCSFSLIFHTKLVYCCVPRII